jgi:phenylalanyl-tRNA synthetase beta chain
MKECLEKMGYNYSKGEVEIPSWRIDVLHEVDLIEDIAISYGYEKFEPEIPEISNIGKIYSNEIIKEKISEILTGIELIETSNYHLTTKEEQFSNMGIPEKEEKGYVQILNSKTEYNILRKNLSSYILKTFSRNIDNEYPQKIFEIGKIFEQNFKGDIEEKEFLAIGISPGNFTEMKQILEYFAKMLNLKFEIKESEKENDFLIEGRTAEIFLEKTLIGKFGEVHPKILKNWKIKMPVSLLEINLKEIFKKFN